MFAIEANSLAESRAPFQENGSVRGGDETMSCYTRHLGDVFLENTRANRKAADSHIRKTLDIAEADCPQVWKEVKARLNDPEGREELVASLRGRMGVL